MRIKASIPLHWALGFVGLIIILLVGNGIFAYKYFNSSNNKGDSSAKAGQE